jgi:hypothetical protein
MRTRRLEWGIAILGMTCGALLGGIIEPDSSPQSKAPPGPWEPCSASRRMLPDGFFPLGFCEKYGGYPGDPDAQNAKRLADLEQIRAGGFNLMRIYLRYPPDMDLNGVDTQFLNQALSEPNHPVYVCDTLYDPTEDPTQAWRTIVGHYKAHPALYAWGTYDDVDCRWANWDNDPNDPAWCYTDPNCLDPNTPHAPAAVNDTNGEVKQADLADPNDPASALNYTSLAGGAYLDLFAAYDTCDNVDWVSNSFFPIPWADIRGVNERLNVVIDDFPTHPVVAFVQTWRDACGGLHDPNDPNSPLGRLPTPEEARNMTYQALVAGAAGIVYYAFNEYVDGATCVDLGDLNDPEVAALWGELTALAGEINRLNSERFRPLFSDLMFKETDGNVRWAYWICYDPNDLRQSELYAVVVNVREDTHGDYGRASGVRVLLPVPCDAPGERLDGNDPNDPWPLSLCSDPSDPDFQSLPALGVYVYRFPLPICRGDMNCDGVIDSHDVAPFAVALGNYETWMVAYPDCSILNGDINGDNQVNVGDINPLAIWLADHFGESCP